MPITVYIDGQCPLCVAGALRFQALDRAKAIRFVDNHDPQWEAQAGARFTSAELTGSMRAQMEDGTWRTGWFAWAALLTALPLTQGLGRLMRWPFFYGIGPAWYKWVAAHRLELSRLMHLPPPCDEHGICRLAVERKNK